MPTPTIPEVVRSEWFGFEQLDFTVDGRACLLVRPAAPAAGLPWIWRTEFFGHEPQGDLALLAQGYHVAYMEVRNMYGAPKALDHMDRFHAHLTSVHGLARKPVLEGFSRGGLYALNWAARNPRHVASLYLDAPVCDFKSWPGGRGKGHGSASDWELCKDAYGFSEEQALGYTRNPVDNLKPLAEAKIPILCVCVDADAAVPLDENARVVEARYRNMGGEIVLIVKPGVGHHPHSLEDPAPIVDFVLRHAPQAES
ncbi:MAG: alpha/beta hydrolase [Planctomycetes bacterium]|nr:alpha/beta hydrolase [Planctomycetota bacterium]